MRLPFAIGAVVLGLPWTFQTPLSGQVSPVCAVLPTGMILYFLFTCRIGSAGISPGNRAAVHAIDLLFRGSHQSSTATNNILIHHQ